MWITQTANREKRNCPHLETIATRFAGLERLVCQACGHISLQNLYDLGSEEAVTNRYAPAAQAS